MEAVACELKYSGVGLGVLLLALGATLAIVLVMPLAPLPLAASMLLAVALALRACRALIAPRSLRLDRTRRIQVRDDTGWRSGEVRDGSFVMPWLTIVRWRAEGERFDGTLLLLPDMARTDELRKIRVILRWA